MKERRAEKRKKKKNGYGTQLEPTSAFSQGRICRLLVNYRKTTARRKFIALPVVSLTRTGDWPLRVNSRSFQSGHGGGHPQSLNEPRPPAEAVLGVEIKSGHLANQGNFPGVTVRVRTEQTNRILRTLILDLPRHCLHTDLFIPDAQVRSRCKKEPHLAVSTNTVEKRQ